MLSEESGRATDALFYWFLGQTLSLFGLAAGAVPIFLANEPYFGPHCSPAGRSLPGAIEPQEIVSAAISVAIASKYRVILLPYAPTE